MSSKSQESTQGDSLVFITYSDTQQGRAHDSETRQLVRKKAYHAYRTRESRGLRRREVVFLATNSSLKQGVGRFRIRKELQKGDPSEVVRRETPKKLSPFEPILTSLGDDAWDILEYCISLRLYLSKIMLTYEF